MSKTQRQNSEEWDASDPCRGQPMSPIQFWILQFLAGACADSAQRLFSKKPPKGIEARLRKVDECRARLRLCRQFNDASTND
jgi:hypothetical protein